MKFLFFLFFLFSSLSCGSCYTKPLKIVATIPPLASLVKSLVGDAGEVRLLLESEGSPHSYYMKPSDLLTVESADIILWIGPELESFLVPILEKVDKKSVKVFSALSVKDLVTYGYRCVSDGHHAQCHHHHGDLDPHIWLDPYNMILVAEALKESLIHQFPSLKNILEENFKELKTKLANLDQKVKNILRNSSSQSFFVIHDALQYLEESANLKPSLPMSTHPESGLTIRRLRTLKKIVRLEKVRCLFGDKAYDPELLAKFARKLNLSYKILDVLGYRDYDTPLDYEDMMTSLVLNMSSCLTAARKP
tara:strand:+ start:723 stop:1643 length:921 start_codon:yes stop_codon:yes gene_type:complete